MGKMGSKLGAAARMHNTHGFARPITTRTFTCHFTSRLLTQTLNRIYRKFLKYWTSQSHGMPDLGTISGGAWANLQIRVSKGPCNCLALPGYRSQALPGVLVVYTNYQLLRVHTSSTIILRVRTSSLKHWKLRRPPESEEHGRCLTCHGLRG